MIGIYKITSPSGKVYIGQSKHIKFRFDTYRRLHNQVQSSPKLYRSLKKYGYDNHIFEIIEECLFYELNEKERYWQDLYNATGKNGLNCILTKTDVKKGENRPISEKQKKQISQVHKGKILTEETKKKIGAAFKGRKLSEEHKIKIGLKSKGNKYLVGFKHSEQSKINMALANAKTKVVLDIQTGIFYTTKEYAELNNINLNTLRGRLNGNLKNDTNLIYV